MTNELLLTVGGIISTAAGSWISYFFTRKKYNSEVDGNVIRNMQESLEFYTKLSDDNKERLQEALAETKALKEENAELRKEVNKMRDQIYNLMESICLDLTCSMRTKMPKEQLIQNDIKNNAAATKNPKGKSNTSKKAVQKEDK